MLRIYTIANVIEIEPKEDIDKDIVLNAIDNSDSIVVETKQGTTVIINNINTVAIEIIDKE